jgi:hypothetical protein
MTLLDTQIGTFALVLDRLRNESVPLFGASALSIQPVRQLIRPFSQVLEVDLRAEGRSVRAFIKILTPRASHPEELEATSRNTAREFDALVTAHAALSRYAGLSTARPLACYPDLFALVTERVPGTPLDRLLSGLRGVPSARTIDSASAVMHTVGAWLAAFQTTGATDTRISLDRMRTYLDARLQPLVIAGLISEAVRGGLLRYFDGCAAKVTGAELIAVPVHADFTPENVMVSPGGVAVLDFTMAKQGARYLDLAHMFMHLQMLKARPWFRPAVLDRQTTALMAGFDPAVAPERPLFQLLLLQHVACSVRQTVEVSGIPGRLLSGHVRRRHLKWLAARASSS